VTAEQPTYSALGADWENNSERPHGPGRYDGASCHRPDTGGQRGAVPPEDNCITCGDIAVEVRVVRLLADELAVVDTGAGEETVSVALVSAAAGDMILVHAGEALTVLGSAGQDAAAPGATR
jgi:hydrogenase expression/formation protein HypC